MKQEDLVVAMVANLARQIEWIKMADVKANFAFAFNMAMLCLLAAVAPKTMSSWHILPLATAIIATVLLLISLICLKFVMMPRTWGPLQSLIYCGQIAQLHAETYKDAVYRLDDKGYMNDLISQCHRNAEIANDKFNWVQRSIFFLFVGSPFWALSVWLLYSGPARA